MKHNNTKKGNYAPNIFDFVKEKINIIDLISRDEELKHTFLGYRGSHKALHESKSGNCLFVNETVKVLPHFLLDKSD